MSAPACGGTTAGAGNGDGGQSGSDDAGVPSDDGGSEASDDADSAADAYVEPPDDGPWPADHYPLPLLMYQGGPVLTAPQFITATFVGDLNRDARRAFDDSVGPSAWFASMVDGYGIDAGTGGVYAELVDTVSNKTLDDVNDIKPMIQSWVAAGALPTPTTNTVYIIYFPASTTITLYGETSCTQYGAYHASTGIIFDAGVDAYAIIPDCGGGMTETTLDVSHELDEAATDPHPNAGGAYFGIDDAWWGVGGGEAADVCQRAGPMQEGADYVARAWNNKAAAASHDPCQPAAQGEIYYGAAVPTQILRNLADPNGGTYDSDGYVVVKRGQTKTLDVVVFSDAKLPNDVSLTVGQRQHGVQTLGAVGTGITASVSPTKGHNGVHVTLTLQVDSSTATGNYPFVVRSTLSAGAHNDWPVILKVE